MNVTLVLTLHRILLITTSWQLTLTVNLFKNYRLPILYFDINYLPSFLQVEVRNQTPSVGIAQFLRSVTLPPPDNVSQDDGTAIPVDGPISPQVAENESTIVMDAESSFAQPDPPVSVVK